MKSRSKRLGLLFLLLALAGGLALGVYYVTQQIDGSEALPDGGVTAWTCPMHPEVIADRPGDCSLCNMKLVPTQQAETNK